MVAIRRLVALVEPAKLRGKLTLVPVVNEAAFLRGHRTADDGLDLAFHQTDAARELLQLAQRPAAAAPAPAQGAPIRSYFQTASGR